jgi:DNA-binding LacI/PurR family transcriptional regulator/DNA-binding transcriptional regulator YhcF (GntR family)
MTTFTHSKPQRLTDRLRQDILAKRLRPGEPLPSIRTLMSSDQVSKGTVVQALKLLSESGLVEHHPCRGYFVSNADNELKPDHVSQVVLVSLALDRDLIPYYQGLCNVVGQEKNVLPGIFGCNAHAAAYPDLISRVLRMRPAGMVLNVVPKEVVQLDTAELTASDVPMVFIGSGCESVRVDRVLMPMEMTGRRVVEYALEKGYRDFGILSQSPVNSDQENWERTVIQTLAQAGISMPESHIIRAQGNHGYSENPDPLIDMQQAVAQALAQGIKPRVLLASHDYPAISAMRALRNAHVRIPDEVAVLSCFSCHGYDLEPGLPKLTTVLSHRQRMGELAGRSLLERMKNPDLPACVHHLPVELAVGESG